MMSIKGYLLIALAGLCMAFSGCGVHPSFKTTLVVKDQSGNVKTQFTTGEPIFFELSITNITDVPMTLTLASPQIYEFLVAPAGETQPVWHWSSDKVFPAVIVELSFAAGETKTYLVVWDQINDAGRAVTPGDYVAQGFMWTVQEAKIDVISAETETRSAPVSFSIQ